MRRGAFTLIEMMVSITILSIMLIFLYKSYAELGSSNAYFKEKSMKLATIEAKKEALFLDITLSHAKSIAIHNQDRVSDVVFMQSSNTLYNNINPYIAYIKKGEKLYRLESHRAFKEYPLSSDSDFFAESMGEVKRFRLYKKSVDANSSEEYLLDVELRGEEPFLYKLKPLNEY
ncbi:MAG: prepilin-type N-terminal cleavage/methylation domain-containing protein [Epsilonproteobacteria bacterium]|nr:prepilin-type N-terminal cleavage/methylation domain-containing protein [Campylobacterota bacterium]